MRDSKITKGVIPRKINTDFETSENFILGQPLNVNTARHIKNSRTQVRTIAPVAKFPMVLVLGNFL
jgi:hypothetical protein